MGYSSRIVDARKLQQLHPRTTKHPGSKRGYIPKPGMKGNSWRAMTRSLRRYPGWHKRIVNLAREEAKRHQPHK